jgi:anaerobic magnesium-protoporphyrin IX monomethyl ester cyclase
MMMEQYASSDPHGVVAPRPRLPRVMLVKGHFNDPSSRQFTHPLGLMYLAAALREGYECELRLVDMRVEEYSYERLEQEMRSFAPAFVGISAQTAETVSMAKIAACAKKVDPDIVVLLGGPHATAYSEQAAESPDIDYVVAGEGEIVIGELIQRLSAGESVRDLPGLVFRHDGGLIDNGRAESCDDLDELPRPAYDLVPVREYKKFYRFSRTGSGDYMSLFSSRACPYRCIYCHNIFGKKFRPRSAANLFEEIRYLYDTYQIREFEILDDIFNLDRNRLLEFCDMVIRSELDLTFTFPNGLRCDRLDEEQLRKLRDAGTIYISFAVETASPRLQKLIKKNIKLDRIRENIEIARSLGIHAHGFFMMGFPTETLEEMGMTVDFILSSKLHTFNLFMVQAFEGTELGHLVKETGRGVVTDFSQDYYTRSFHNLTDVPVKAINRLRRKALLRFYGSPWRIYTLLRDFPGDMSPLTLAKLLGRRLLGRS